MHMYIQVSNFRRRKTDISAQLAEGLEVLPSPSTDTSLTEYIAIEDDNVMTHFLQVFVIGMEDCSECWYWQFRWMSALLFT